jgi:C4-type Zn-finger protein
MLILKLGVAQWTPVGDEMMKKVVSGKNATAALVICDSEGNSKAMSAWIPLENAEKASMELEAEGIPVFPGEVKLPI